MRIGKSPTRIETLAKNRVPRLTDLQNSVTNVA